MKQERKFIGLKDIVFVTLLTAISIVIATLLVVPFSFNLYLVLFLVTFLDMLIIGPIYTLACARAPRIGTHLLFCFLFAIYYFFTNTMIVISLIIVAAGIVGELILYKGGYRSALRMTAAFALFGVSVMLAPVLLVYINFDSMAATLLASGLTQEYIDGMLAVYAPLNVFIGVACSVVGSILGCFIGRKLLKKHFMPAGIAEE